MRAYYANLSAEDRRRVFVAGRDVERVRAADLARHAAQRGDPARYAMQRAAITAVNNAVRDGRLERGPCEVCGATPAQGHHDDYGAPLEVRWLCTTHHAEHHAGF